MRHAPGRVATWSSGWAYATVLSAWKCGLMGAARVALRRLQTRYPKRQLTAASYWELGEKELAELAEGPRKSMGHACEFETSMIMALRPELVRRDLGERAVAV